VEERKETEDMSTVHDKAHGEKKVLVRRGRNKGKTGVLVSAWRGREKETTEKTGCWGNILSFGERFTHRGVS